MGDAQLNDVPFLAQRNTKSRLGVYPYGQKCRTLLNRHTSNNKLTHFESSNAQLMAICALQHADHAVLLANHRFQIQNSELARLLLLSKIVSEADDLRNTYIMEK